MLRTKRLSIILSVVIFLVISLTPAARTGAYAADTFYNGGAGATGVRELPLFVEKDFKLFDKYGEEPGAWHFFIDYRRGVTW